MQVLDKSAKPVIERLKEETPRPATPAAILRLITRMVKKAGSFDRVSVGFPGVIRDGIVETAPNLDPSWHGVNLQEKVAKICKKPVRSANDAAVQGLGDIKGKGVEMVITLGTGMGSALYLNGKLVPNLELGHHPFRKGLSYEDYLGKAGLKKHGKKKWNKHLKLAIDTISRIFNYDHLYIGGGNAELIDFELPANVEVASNLAGLWGGIALWNQ